MQNAVSLQTLSLPGGAQGRLLEEAAFELADIGK